MTVPPPAIPPRAAALDDCWNRIGLRGDHSCPKLVEHVHCRNCSVYRQAALDLLDVVPSAKALDEGASYYAQSRTPSRLEARSVFLFRLGNEWLGLSTAAVAEVVERGAICALPHRPRHRVLGLTNVRGELVVCVSLGTLMELASAPQQAAVAGRVQPRLLVLRGETGRVAFPVDEAYGPHRFSSDDVLSTPAALANSSSTLTQRVLRWGDRAVGHLDEQRVYSTMMRSLS